MSKRLKKYFGIPIVIEVVRYKSQINYGEKMNILLMTAAFLISSIILYSYWYIKVTKI